MKTYQINTGRLWGWFFISSGVLLFDTQFKLDVILNDDKWLAISLLVGIISFLTAAVTLVWLITRGLGYLAHKTERQSDL
ncbi:MAG: hypothetical protein WCI79_03245 [Candidatus Saccharibacteria bacterium]